MILRAISGYLSDHGVENTPMDRSLPTFLERHYILCYPALAMPSAVTITHNEGVVEVQRFPKSFDRSGDYERVAFCVSDPDMFGKVLGAVRVLSRVDGGVL